LAILKKGQANRVKKNRGVIFCLGNRKKRRREENRGETKLQTKTVILGERNEGECSGEDYRQKAKSGKIKAVVGSRLNVDL